MNYNKKRNRSAVSSTGEVDASINESPVINPKKKPNKKKPTNNTEQDILVKKSEKHEHKESEMTLQTIKQELSQINKKLANVMQKYDGSIRTMIKETIAEMKEELLKAVDKRLDILESRLFDKEVDMIS
jgi:molecular chaperone GrpE (heat shock protein)